MDLFVQLFSLKEIQLNTKLQIKLYFTTVLTTLYKIADKTLNRIVLSRACR